MQLITINKICKLKFVKNQKNHPRFVHKLLLKGLFALKNYCNFLTIFFKKKYPKFPKKIVVDEQDYEEFLSSNEDLMKIPKKLERSTANLSKRTSRVLVTQGSNISLKRIGTNISLESVNEKLEPKSVYDGDYGEDDEYFEKIMQLEKYKLKKINGFTFFFF